MFFISNRNSDFVLINFASHFVAEICDSRFQLQLTFSVDNRRLNISRQSDYFDFNCSTNGKFSGLETCSDWVV